MLEPDRETVIADWRDCLDAVPLCESDECISVIRADAETAWIVGYRQRVTLIVRSNLARKGTRISLSMRQHQRA